MATFQVSSPTSNESVPLGGFEVTGSATGALVTVVSWHLEPKIQIFGGPPPKWVETTQEVQVAPVITVTPKNGTPHIAQFTPTFRGEKLTGSFAVKVKPSILGSQTLLVSVTVPGSNTLPASQAIQIVVPNPATHPVPGI